MKFLHGVNTETRKLIKRSSREKELKGRFKVEEMSSISTLEIAWEDESLWSGDLYDETDFSNRVLLERINSSCSSGRKRRKSVIGIEGRLKWPHS